MNLNDRYEKEKELVNSECELSSQYVFYNMLFGFFVIAFLVVCVVGATLILSDRNLSYKIIALFLLNAELMLCGIGMIFSVLRIEKIKSYYIVLVESKLIESKVKTK